jgi:uncharacterized MAPEG superfamily protein
LPRLPLRRMDTRIAGANGNRGEEKMSVELQMLAWSTTLLIVLVLIQALAGVQGQGLMAQMGPRDDQPAPKKYHARMLRVVDNHREGLTMFAPLVLIAAVAQISNEWTVLGAQLFFYSRVVHAILYIAGVPMVRPLVWTVGVIGTLMVLLAVLGLI